MLNVGHTFSAYSQHYILPGFSGRFFKKSTQKLKLSRRSVQEPTQNLGTFRVGSLPEPTRKVTFSHRFC